MKYELEIKKGNSKKTGKPYTMFIIHATTDDGAFSCQGVANLDYATKQAFEMMKEVDG